jgi:hypothetical protein
LKICPRVPKLRYDFGGVGEVFKGYSADMFAGKSPLTLMGGRATVKRAQTVSEDPHWRERTFFYVDKSNACDVEKVKTEPEEVEVKEFKEDNKALVPSRLRLDHSMLVLLKLIIFKGMIWTTSGSVVWRFFFSRAFDFEFI